MPERKKIERYYSREKVEFLRTFIHGYMDENGLTPQQMYDLIMQPEIKARISDAWTENGIRLSKVKARPHPKNGGRDIIRNWTERYPFSVHESFLPKADRFLKETARSTQSPHLHEQTRLERRAKLAALRELTGTERSSSARAAGLKTDHTYCAALIDLSNDDCVLGCMIFQFEDDATGSFHMFRFNAQLYRKTREFNLKDGNCQSLLFSREQTAIFASGLCSVRSGGLYKNGAISRIEVDALYSDVIDTSTVGDSEFWFSQSGLNPALGRFSLDFQIKRKVGQDKTYERHEISIFAGVFYKDQKDQYGERLRLADFPISDERLTLLEEMASY